MRALAAPIALIDEDRQVVVVDRDGRFHPLTRPSGKSGLWDSLAADGVLAVNIVSAVAPPDDRPWKAVYRTLSEVFPNVRAFVASDPNDGLANILLFASVAPLKADPPKTPERSSHEVALMLSRELRPTPRELAPAPILTDDYAPLDALMAGTTRRWRRLLQQVMPEVLLD